MPEIEIQGGKPEERSSLTLNIPAGRPRIGMRDKRGKERLLMRLTDCGAAELRCQDEAEKVIWQAPSTAKESSADKPKKVKQEKKEEQEKQ